jgi:hypothetical protein
MGVAILAGEARCIAIQKVSCRNSGATVVRLYRLLYRLLGRSLAICG